MREEGVRSGSGGLKCYIDGIEIPIISAQVSYQQGAPASASIEVIATGPFQDLVPRSLVALFYLDPQLQASEVRGGANITWKTVTALDPRAWKLLFLGEIAVLSTGRGAGARQGSIYCVDLSAYLSSLRQLMGAYGAGTPDRYENAFLGSRGDRAARFSTTQRSVESNLLNLLTTSTVKVGGEDVPSIYLGVHRLIREQFFAAHLFYAMSFNRHRMNDLFFGLPNDATAAKLFKLSYFKQWINNQVGQAGGMLTAKGLVDTLLGTVYHTITSIPCPMFDRSGALRGFNPDKDDSDLAREIIQRDAWTGSCLHLFCVQPDAQFLVPPTCNIFFPEHIVQMQTSRNLLEEPTRLLMRLSTNSGFGLDQLTTERFYAPDFEALRELMKVKGSVGDRMSSTLLPHERFAGINPLMSWQPGVGAYAAKGARREYLTQVADHDFWRARFGQRQLSLEGPFNPSAIPGYSGVVLERPNNRRQDNRNRHYVGHVVSVSHTFRPDGAFTSAMLTAVRLYDEEIDFDGKGRSLEEVASRGTDGFLDDRYDPAKISDEIYRPMYGCDAITKVFTLDRIQSLSGTMDSETVDRIKAAKDKYGEVAASVLCIEARYQSLVFADGDVAGFVMDAVRRPTADRLEMLGLGRSEGWMQETLGPSYEGARNKDVPESDPYQGFLSVAVDTDAWDFRYDKYQLTKRSTVPAGTRKIPAITREYWDHTDGSGALHYRTAEVTPEEIQKLTRTATSLTEPKSYGLQAHLLARQEYTNAYVESLRDTGQRG